MAKPPNVLALLKNVKRFLDDVKIDPKAKNFRALKNELATAKKACRDVLKTVEAFEGEMTLLYRLPCGKIPERKVLVASIPCKLWPIRQPLSGSIELPEIIVTAPVMARFKPFGPPAKPPRPKP